MQVCHRRVFSMMKDRQLKTNTPLSKKTNYKNCSHPGNTANRPVHFKQKYFDTSDIHWVSFLYNRAAQLSNWNCIIDYCNHKRLLWPLSMIFINPWHKKTVVCWRKSVVILKLSQSKALQSNFSVPKLFCPRAEKQNHAEKLHPNGMWCNILWIFITTKWFFAASCISDV